MVANWNYSCDKVYIAMKNCAHNKEILIIGVVIYQIGRAFIVQDTLMDRILQYGQFSQN